MSSGISPSQRGLFDRLWEDYTAVTPSAKAIYRLLGEKDAAPIVNDHIAFRTFNRGPVRLDSFVKSLERFDYQPKGSYFFKEKKLRAHHFESGEGAPRIFVSELLCEEFSPAANAIIDRVLAKVSPSLDGSPDLLLATGAWPAVSFADYETLMKESEYAAWVAAFRIRANHFTAAVHLTKRIVSLEETVRILEEAGYTLNSSGGVIKGSPVQLLEQGSTMADRISWAFSDGVRTIPSCYYEFARRYPDKDGRPYGGFIEKSADKIFESTR